MAPDLSRYRTEALGDRIAAVLSLPGRLAELATTLAGVVLAVQLTVVACTVGVGAPWWAWAVAAAYGLAVGLVLGATAALLRLAHAELGRAQELLTELLRVTILMLGDLDDLRSGAVPVPGAGALVRSSWEQVVAPLVVGAAQRQLGRWGRPAGWILRALVGRGVRSMADTLEHPRARSRSSVVPPVLEDAAATLEGTAPPPDAEVRSRLASLASALVQAGSGVTSVASRLRRLLLPLWIAFGLACAAAATPLVAWVWWTGG
ncbi:MAG: hypothetical protein H6732_04840 [Alphaproteobacteria bacterium]|nr:hypothetical protein [Alphaproteobacteria bacterium]